MPPRKPTPRTATTKWKNLRVKILLRDQRNGVTNCPECGILLDYKQSGLRNSAEVDHIVPVAQGGTDSLQNLRSCCRHCNASMGAKLAKKKPKPLDVELPGWSESAELW